MQLRNPKQTEGGKECLKDKQRACEKRMQIRIQRKEKTF